MEPENPSISLSGSNAAADFVNPITDQCPAVFKVTENADNPDMKKDTKPPKVTSKSSLKRKKPEHPPTSTMVLESIKSLKMRKGASAQAIGEFIEGHYALSAKQMKPYVDRFLKTAVEKGILEQVSGVGEVERFKIKKMEPVKQTNPKTAQCSTSKVTENADKPDLKKDTKPLKITSTLKRKKSNHPPISTMVLESIKSLKMRKGVSAQSIGEFVEEHYSVSAKQMKPYIDRFLKTGVEKGILEQVSGVGEVERFKIKKTEPVKQTNPKTDQCSIISKVTDYADKPDFIKDTKPLKITSTLKRKKPNHPHTSTMVLESIKSLKMRKGASAQAIGEFIEGHYGVSAKQMKPYVSRFLKTGVEKGILEHVSGVGERFKIKKTEKIKEAEGNVRVDEKKRMKPNMK